MACRQGPQPRHGPLDGDEGRALRVEELDEGTVARQLHAHGAHGVVQHVFDVERIAHLAPDLHGDLPQAFDLGAFAVQPLRFLRERVDGAGDLTDLGRSPLLAGASVACPLGQGDQRAAERVERAHEAAGRADGRNEGDGDGDEETGQHDEDRCGLQADRPHGEPRAVGLAQFRDCGVRRTERVESALAAADLPRRAHRFARGQGGNPPADEMLPPFGLTLLPRQRLTDVLVPRVGRRGRDGARELLRSFPVRLEEAAVLAEPVAAHAGLGIGHGLQGVGVRVVHPLGARGVLGGADRQHHGRDPCAANRDHQ